MGFNQKASWVLSEGETALAESRQHVVAECADMPADARDTAVLLADEVVANALQHGQGTVVLAVFRDGRRLRVEVQDECPDRPVLMDLGLFAECGRGMQLVESLSSSWGCDARCSGSGKCVWFECGGARG